MITGRHLAAAAGFAFVAIWITLSFGGAVLCLLGALAFYFGAVQLERAGGFNLDSLVSRFGGEGSPTPRTGPAQSRARQP